MKAPDAPKAPPADLLLKTMLIALFLLVLVPTVALALRGNFTHFARDFLYAIATGVLLHNVWRGSVWSWRVTVALCMLTGTAVFFGGLFVGDRFLQGVLFSAVGLAFLALGLLLVADGPIRRELEGRWAGRGLQMQSEGGE